MSVALIILTLNEIDGIKVILPQIKKEWAEEIVVVDGGSTDGTIEECKKMGIPNSSGSFSDLFAKMERLVGQKRLQNADIGSAMNMTSEEKQISFLNRYFVFKKVREVDAERSFLAQVGADCKSPIACYAIHEHSQIRLRSLVANEDGELILTDDRTGDDAIDLGKFAANALIAKGARRLFQP